MIKDLSISRAIFIVPFIAFTLSKFSAIAMLEISMTPLFLITAIIFGFLYFTKYKLVVNLITNLAVSFQMTTLLNYFMTNKSVSMLTIWFITVTVAIFLVLSFLPLVIKNKQSINSISNSLIAVGAGTVLLTWMKTYISPEILALTLPVVASCIYVILSNKAEYGISILMNNTIGSLAIAFLINTITEKLEILPSFDVYDSVLVMTWISTFVISFLYQEEPFQGFKLGYQRYLNERDEIYLDINALKRNLENADQLSTEELFQTINPLKNIRLESNISELLPRTITRFNLHEKRKEMRVTNWLLVFGAYTLFGAGAFYQYQTYEVEWFILMLSALIYLLAVPVATHVVLTKKMIQYVNTKIIDPFNILILERKELIHHIKEILLARGYTAMTIAEFEDVYSAKNERFETPETPLNLEEKSAI